MANCTKFGCVSDRRARAHRCPQPHQFLISPLDDEGPDRHDVVVSRDLFVQDIPRDATLISDIPDDWRPDALPFDRLHVVDIVRQVVPTADFSDPSWGHIDLPGVAIEISVGDEIPLESFALHVRAADVAAAEEILTAILQRLGVRAFDASSPNGIFP